MLEKWNIDKKTERYLIFISEEGDRNKMIYHPVKPSIPKFHYSSIPFYLKTAKLLIA
jgi:hypothetical protein